MTRQEHIAAHVSALIFQNYHSHLNVARPDHRKIMDVWQKALSDLPNDAEVIDKLFNPYYSEKSMPTADEVRAAWWRMNNPGLDNRSEFERKAVAAPTLSDLAKAARNAYAREIVKLVCKKLPKKEHYTELKRLSDEYDVACPPVEVMLSDG